MQGISAGLAQEQQDLVLGDCVVAASFVPQEPHLYCLVLVAAVDSFFGSLHVAVVAGNECSAGL